MKAKTKKSKSTDFSEMSIDKFFETVDADSENDMNDEDATEQIAPPKKTKKLVKKKKDTKTKTEVKVVEKKNKSNKYLVVETDQTSEEEEEEKEILKKDKKNKKKNKLTIESNGFEEEEQDNHISTKDKKKKKKKTVDIDEQENENRIEKPKKKKKKGIKANGHTNGIDNDEKVDDIEDHKDHLNKLKEIDPEFYTFLQKNDKKLLTFNLDDEFADNDDDNDNDNKKLNKDKNKKKKNQFDDDNDEEQLHQPTGEFEVASDESDFVPSDAESEQEHDPSKPRTITLKLLKEWEIELSQDKPNVAIIRTVLSAFNSALISISEEKHKKNNKLRVDGAAVFNGVLQLCILYLETAIRKFIGIDKKSSREPHTSKKWTKISGPLRSYFIDMTKLIENVSSSNIQTVILKHLHQILPFVHSFTSVTKPILKRLIILWSTSDETVRIISFLCILRLTRSEQQLVLNNVLRTMYFAYVRNSKFVSINTLSSINFMRRSLIELFCLDLNITYNHCFLYIRQLAIHLRNSVTLQKKDSIVVICNWQYINSLRLWADLLAITYNQKQLQPLLYPLISIITGCIRLLAQAKFFPLRFHLCQILIKLSNETNVFIPVLPYILETLNSKVFNEKHKKISMKPKPFTCILRVTENDLIENTFRDEVIDNVYNLTLEYMANESYHITFSDLTIFALKILKNYIKVTKNPKYARKLKQLVDKIQENNNFIENEKKTITFTLNDIHLIESWESTLKNKGTPLLTYYNNWLPAHNIKQRRQATNSDNIADYNLPILKRRLPGTEKIQNDGPVTLFPSDDEDDDLEFEEKPKKKQKLIDHEDDDEDDAKKKKKNKKNKKVHVEKKETIPEKDYYDCEDVDIVKDLDLNDWD